MRFFLNSASPEEARRAREWSLLDGVTISPALASGRPGEYRQVIREMAAVGDGPVVVHVASTDAKGMYKEGREYHKLGKDIVIQLPMTPEGLKVVRLLSQDQIATSVSLCFSAAQALLAAKAGAAYVSPVVGRLDEIGSIGMDLVEQIIRIYDNYGYQTLVLVDSVRNPVHVLDAALLGADVAAMPFEIFEQLFRHPLTQAGLDREGRESGASPRRHS